MTLVGDLGINTQWCGLAYDAALDSLYLSDTISDNLHTVDRLTGLATLVGAMESGMVKGLAGENRVIVGQ